MSYSSDSSKKSMVKISAAKRSNVSEMKLALSRCTIQDPHGGRGEIHIW